MSCARQTTWLMKYNPFDLKVNFWMMLDERGLWMFSSHENFVEAINKFFSLFQHNRKNVNNKKQINETKIIQPIWIVVNTYCLWLTTHFQLIFTTHYALLIYKDEKRKLPKKAFNQLKCMVSWLKPFTRCGLNWFV